MVTFLITVELHIVCHHLLLSDVFEDKKLSVVLAVVIIRTRSRTIIEALTSIVCSTHRRIDSPIRDRRRSIHRLRCAHRHDTLALILKFLEFVHTFTNLTLPLIFFD